jgi:hypothetical protein
MQVVVWRKYELEIHVAFVLPSHYTISLNILAPNKLHAGQTFRCGFLGQKGYVSDATGERHSLVLRPAC